MSQLYDEMTLHIEDDIFQKLRSDTDQVLQKLLSNMAEKGSLEGKMTITVDVLFAEEQVRNTDPKIDGDFRIVHTPKFQHKVGSTLTIKNEQRGNMNCDGMEMVWDGEKNEYVLKPITGRDQMSIFDMEYPEKDPEQQLLPEPHEDSSNGQLEDSHLDDPQDNEDISEEFYDFEYQEPMEF